MFWDRFLEGAGFAFGVLADSALLSMQDKNIDGGLKCFLTKCLWQLNMALENAPLGASKVVSIQITSGIYQEYDFDTQELMEARADEQKAQAWAQQAGRLRFVETC